jgi:hypothetical protein
MTQISFVTIGDDEAWAHRAISQVDEFAKRGAFAIRA